MTKKFISITLIFIFHFSIVQAATVTIDKVPPELTRLRATYKKETQNITTAATLTNFKKDYKNAKIAAKRSPTYLRQLKILENNRDRDIKRIQDRFQASLAKLDKGTLAVVDQKYKKELTLLQSRSSKRLKINYLADLKNLEKRFIAQNNLEAALLTQKERKMIQEGKGGAVNTKVATTHRAKPAAHQVPAKSVAPPKTQKTARKQPVHRKKAAVSRKLTEDNPQVYSSSAKGLAGSGNNIKNSVYTFQITRLGTHSTLSFQGWGTKTTNTIGDVFLIDSSGTRHKVAQWSPANLKASTFYEVKGAKDIEPIETDISTLLIKPGTYKVEFKYRDGFEAFVIYRVMIQTW